MMQQDMLITTFLIGAQGTMAVIFFLTVARSAAALDAARILRKLTRQADNMAEDRIAPEALDPRLQQPYYTLAEGFTDNEEMRSIESWVVEGLDKMVSLHHHQLASLRRTGPQLGLFFTVLALVIGLSGVESGSSVLATTLGPALVTTAVAAGCNAIIGAVQSRLEWALDMAEHAIVEALRKVRLQNRKLNFEGAE